MAFLTLIVTPILLFFLYKYLIYPAFLSPLSRIPSAHLTSRFSNLWIKYQRYRNKANRATHLAHEKLGPIVRLGVSEVSVNDIDAVRLIYGGYWDRDEWYSRAFDNYGFVVEDG